MRRPGAGNSSRRGVDFATWRRSAVGLETCVTACLSPCALSAEPLCKLRPCGLCEVL